MINYKKQNGLSNTDPKLYASKSGDRTELFNENEPKTEISKVAAIRILTKQTHGTSAQWREAIAMAVKAISQSPTLERDGTLIIKTDLTTKAKRVLLEDGKYGTLYYPD